MIYTRSRLRQLRKQLESPPDLDYPKMHQGLILLKVQCLIDYTQALSSCNKGKMINLSKIGSKKKFIYSALR